MAKRSIGGRLDRLTQRHGEADVQQLAQRIADGEGIPVEELLAEAARAAGICQAEGITTVAGMIAYQAGELGIPVNELEAEVAQIRERAAGRRSASGWRRLRMPAKSRRPAPFSIG